MKDLTTTEAVRWLQSDEPTLIVAGAGISMGAPTNAPGVAPFLAGTTTLLEEAAEYVPRDRSYRRRLFPEACYGAIGEAYGTDSHLRIWESLRPEVADQVGAVPAVGHRVIMRLAQRNGWPVLTTNFDCFLETAARALTIDFDLRIPQPWHHELDLISSVGRAIMVKLHGTATEYGTVKATAADLSRCSIILENMRLRPQPRRILIAGYSGRDFDLFPWLTGTMASCEVLWVDRSFAGADGHTHRASTVPGVLTWTGNWNDLAREVAEPSDLAHPAGRPDADIARDFRQAVTDAVDEHVATLLTRRDGRAVAAFTGVLASTGAHRDVAELLARVDDITSRSVRIQTLLWGAHANSSLDRFGTALVIARRARALAWRTLSFYSAGRAAIAVSYAHVANHWLSVLPGGPRARRDQVKKVLALAHVPLVTALYAPLGLWSIIRITGSTGFPPTAQYRFASDYLEHLIRLMALLERLRGKLPTAGSLLDSGWQQIQRNCVRIGYTAGVFNVSKYLSRQQTGVGGPEGTLARALAIGDLLGETLARRDIGSSLAARSRQEPDAAEALREEAVTQLKLALRTALHLGCPSLVLKILLQLKEVGVQCSSPTGVARLIDRTECTAIIRDKARIIAALT
ncbi:SIR2 family protein [Amycolatopsis eburnea]|uniref:SIR2-like domain-containing protein n=1 Tax=Amycolatopsis eburnea TaxID=2267691 RepID=A0A3R9KK03_9PSEU|nr:SIR2 family protein [Amycolatopsis eburnea]RSD16350.1 hypothetical protein EIY87_22110 [Amycolatopsis eburnea]